MHQLEMEGMLRRNGVYVLGDPTCPNFTMPVVVAGADEEAGTPGTMHALICGAPIPRNANGLRPSVTVAGGPFTFETCELATRDDELHELEKELADCELETWKGIVDRMLPIIRFAINFLAALGCRDMAQEARDTIQRIEEIRIAERITKNLAKNITLCM